MRICAATGNAGKLRELRRILEAQGHEVVSQKELGITIEPDETGTTFEANASSRPRPSARPAACPPSPTIPASAWTRWTRSRRLQRPLLRPPRRRRGQQRQAPREDEGRPGGQRGAKFVAASASSCPPASTSPAGANARAASLSSGWPGTTASATTRSSSPTSAVWARPTSAPTRRAAAMPS